MNILLTGDKGYIGAVMMPMLLREGHRSLDSIATGSRGRHLEILRAKRRVNEKIFETSSPQIWLGSMLLFTWLDYRMILWAI